MDIWNTTFYIAIVATVVLTIFLIVRRYGKNKYYHSFVDDDLLHEKRIGGGKNKVYSTNSGTKEYIEKYIIRSSIYEKSVIVNYNKCYQHISYYIKCYNGRGKEIQLIEVDETNTMSISKVILISKATKRVNIVLKEVDGVLLNHSELMPIAKRCILLFSLFLSMDFFSFLYALRHAIAMIALRNQLRPFLMSIWNYVVIGVILVFTILLFIITYTGMRKRNWQKRNGGAVTYEFF